VSVRILIGDCRERMAALQAGSIDSCVTDPPYHLTSIVKRFGAADAAPAKVGQTGAYARASKGFMGQQWDGGDVAFRPETWAEVLRVLKPGAHLVAFSGTRTYHRMACAIEDAGFEIRDQLAWVYGSGFPKSLDVSKAMAKVRAEDVEPVRVVCRFVRAAMDARGLKSRDLVDLFGNCDPRLIDHWAARDTDSQPSLPTPSQWSILKAALGLSGDLDDEVVRLNARKGTHGERWSGAEVIGEVESDAPGFGAKRFNGDRTIRQLDGAAEQWQGWGTALKPSQEPVCLAQKPYTFEQEWVTIRRLIERLWSALWLTLPASDADQFSTLSPHACGVDPSAFAQWIAEQRSNTLAALSGLTDTSPSGSALISSLSTASSWSDTLAASCRGASTFITATGSSATTDLRTLRFCLSQITPASIIQAHKTGRWSNADACNAGRLFNASVAMLRATLELSAVESATDWEAIDCPDAGAPSPNWRPICLARKPLAGTVAANVQAHGTGAINIDGCRVQTDEALSGYHGRPPLQFGGDNHRPFHDRAEHPKSEQSPLGRWPANIIHDGSDEVLAGFPECKGASSNSAPATDAGFTRGARGKGLLPGYADDGSAARFFYCAKATTNERGEGNNHPTVKPVDLMRWLCRLVTPRGGTVLDPFAGSGSTLIAADAEQFDAIGCELSPDYAAIAEQRVRKSAGLFAQVAAA